MSACGEMKEELVQLKEAKLLTVNKQKFGRITRDQKVAPTSSIYSAYSHPQRNYVFTLETVTCY